MRKLTFPPSKSPLNTPKLSTVGNKVMTYREQMTHVILTIQKIAQAIDSLDEASLGQFNLVTSLELHTIANNHTLRLEALDRQNLPQDQQELAIKAQINELTDKISSYVSTIYTTIINTDYLNSLMTACEKELNTLILACEPFVNTDSNRELLSKWSAFFQIHSTVSHIQQRKDSLAKSKADQSKRAKKIEADLVHQTNEIIADFIQEDIRRSSSVLRQHNDNIQRVQEIRRSMMVAEQQTAASYPNMPALSADHIFGVTQNSPLNNYLTQRNLLENMLNDIDSQIRRAPNQYQTLRAAYLEARKVLTELDKQYPLRVDRQGLRLPELLLLRKLTAVCSRVGVSLQFVKNNGAPLQCNPFYRYSQVEINYDRAEHTRNMAALHSVAGELKGHGFKKLGNFLIGFALLLLIITGILACIPSGGGSLLAVVGSFSGIHTLGITALTNMIQAGTTLSAGSAATLSTALGFAGIAGVIGGLGMFAKKDEGLAQAVHSVKMNLSQLSM